MLRNLRDLFRHATCEPFNEVREQQRNVRQAVPWYVTDFIQKSVPPFAASNRPTLCVTAPVNAPFSWLKSSLSRSSDGIAAQFNLTNAPPPVCSACGSLAR
jgi:hypothetical protein